MRPITLLGLLSLCAGAVRADAFELRSRFVRRDGSTDIVLPRVNNFWLLGDASPGESVRFRIQFGVFDDAAGVAPAGGYIGWNLGTLSLTNGQTGTRTPGRIAPFNWAPNPPGNGVPSADPFASLTGIDNTLGLQSPFWGCTPPPNQVPLPQPPPFIRGFNTFISTFEFTIPSVSADFQANIGGNLIAASGWGVTGGTPPNCGDPNNPNDDTPGSITYAPMALPPRGFNDSLRVVVVPAPGAAALFGVAVLLCTARRRW